MVESQLSANITDQQNLDNCQQKLFKSLADFDFEYNSVKSLINANAELIKLIIKKCRTRVKFPYSCGQLMDKDIKLLINRITNILTINYEAIRIERDGNCLY